MNAACADKVPRSAVGRGCPLSSLMGAVFPDVMDKRMEAIGLLYARFMRFGEYDYAEVPVRGKPDSRIASICFSSNQVRCQPGRFQSL